MFGLETVRTRRNEENVAPIESPDPWLAVSQPFGLGCREVGGELGATPCENRQSKYSRTEVRPVKVYVAGPYTGGDPAVNTRTAMLAGAALIEAGHYPFIPHLFHFLHLLSPQPYEVWTDQDFAWLPECGALIRLPGESRGSDAEVEVARKLGIPVYGSVEEFLGT